MEFGGAMGLSQDLQFNERINDARYQNQQMERAKANAAASAKMFADQYSQGAVGSQYDDPIIKDYTHKKMLEAGTIMRSNPNYRYDPIVLGQLKEIENDIKGNQHVLRAVSYVEAKKKLKEDMAESAKNPQLRDDGMYQQRLQEIDNYNKFGHQDGQKAAELEGPQTFTYTKPQSLVDVDKNWQDAGGKFKDVIPKSIKGGRNAYEEVARPKSLNVIAGQEYESNKRTYDLIAKKKGFNESQLLDYIKTGIDSYIPKKRDFGDYGLSDAMYMVNYKKRADGLDRPVNQSAYQEAFVNAKEGVVSPAILEQTYSTKPRNIIYNNKGESQIDNTGNRIFYTGVHKWIERKDSQGKPSKQKVVETYTYLSKDDAKKKGIYDGGTFGFGKGISPEWNKQAEVVNVGEGDKQQEVVKVKSLMPVELNAAYAGAFDTEAHLTKSKLMAQQPQEGDGGGSAPQIGQVQDGYRYTGGDPASPNSWKKL